MTSWSTARLPSNATAARAASAPCGGRQIRQHVTYLRSSNYRKFVRFDDFAAIKHDVTVIMNSQDSECPKRAHGRGPPPRRRAHLAVVRRPGPGRAAGAAGGTAGAGLARRGAAGGGGAGGVGGAEGGAGGVLRAARGRAGRGMSAPQRQPRFDLCASASASSFGTGSRLRLGIYALSFGFSAPSFGLFRAFVWAFSCRRLGFFAPSFGLFRAFVWAFSRLRLGFSASSAGWP